MEPTYTKEAFYIKVFGDQWNQRHPVTSFVNEPAEVYQTLAAPDTIVHKQKHWALAKEGLSKETLIRLKRESGLGWEELANYLQISLRTIQRKSLSFIFPQTISERMLGIADVFAKGYEVFEDPGQFHGWLEAPNAVFEDEKPKSLLNSYYGIDLLLTELGRIEHGIFA